MATDAIAATQTTGLANVQDFLKILLTQITYQDPLKPVDNQQFLAQLAQFTSLEQTQQISTKLDSLIATQASLQSIGLLGRTVDVTTDGGTVSGTVASLSLAGGTPLITLTLQGGASLPGVKLSQVSAVR